MYFFSHLFAGILIGLVFYWWSKDRWLIPACAIGGILPDLIDKPVGYIFLSESLNYGRIFFHSLVFFIIVLVLGILVWHRYGSLLLVGVAAGMLSHQVLDFMWEEYWNWLWPFFGPFRGEIYEDYFLSRIIAELTSPTEWILGLGVVLVCILIFRDEAECRYGK